MVSVSVPPENMHRIIIYYSYIRTKALAQKVHHAQAHEPWKNYRYAFAEKWMSLHFIEVDILKNNFDVTRKAAGDKI